MISPLSSTRSRAPTMRSVGGMFQLGCQPSLTPYRRGLEEPGNLHGLGVEGESTAHGKEPTAGAPCQRRCQRHHAEAGGVVEHDRERSCLAGRK